MMENPWNIKSIYELQYFNCPSCLFKHQSKQEIVNHAYESHPTSINLLLTNIKDDSLGTYRFDLNIMNDDFLSLTFFYFFK